MKKLLNYFLLLGVSFLLATCSSDKEEIVPTNNHVLKSFSVLKSLNQDALMADCEAVIKLGEITLTLDAYDALKSLVVTFTHEGVSVTVGGVQQTSGVTANDFSKPLTYTVETKDGQRMDYQVKVAFAESQPISRFEFLKSVNKDLPKDSKCTFRGQQHPLLPPRTAHNACSYLRDLCTFGFGRRADTGKRCHCSGFQRPRGVRTADAKR